MLSEQQRKVFEKQRDWLTVAIDKLMGEVSLDEAMEYPETLNLIATLSFARNGTNSQLKESRK